MERVSPRVAKTFYLALLVAGFALMYKLAEPLFTLVVVIVILVGVHEFGHFWVARRCGVRVLRFSIGFGPALYRWSDSLGTEYVLAVIPLGGYVRMLDEGVDELAPGEEHLAFNRKPVLQRIAVVLAGPVANLLLAVLAYWALFMAGERGVVPVVGTVERGSVAGLAGVEPGWEIVSVDGRETPTWQAVTIRLVDRIGDTGVLSLSLRDPESGAVRLTEAHLRGWTPGEGGPLLALGIEPWRMPIPPLLDSIVPDSPAAAAGLRAGDLITHADGVAMAEWGDWVDYVRVRPGQPIEVLLQRDGETVATIITPEAVAMGDGSYGRAGVYVQVSSWPEHMVRELHYGPVAALVAASRRTVEMTMLTLEAIGKMLTGLMSPDNLSGPVTIAKVATESAQSGPDSFVAFLALLSISLGVLNLLPIPLLDGGRLLYYAIEMLIGRPLPPRVQLIGDHVGLLVIVGIMVLAVYNDLSRL